MVNECLTLRPQDPERALEAYDPAHGHGPWDERLAAHLLRRAVGGPRPGQAEALARAAPAAAVDGLFASRVPSREEAWDRSGAALATGGERSRLAAWWLMKLAQEERAPGARLTLFWHDHFACAQSKVGDLGFLFAQHRSFAALGEGRFLELLLALARDPALLRFLDGDSNRRGLPNENLAREILELFTLGLGSYEEEDVREAARALTGRVVRGRAYRFVPEYHDPGAKKVLGTDAPDGDAVCRAAVAHPACARFLAAKLWRFYVSPDPPADVIALLAERWRARDLDVAWLLRTLLGSRAFFSAESYRTLVKSPADFVVGTVRALGAAPDYEECARACAAMGQELFEPPGVQGWADGEAWMHSAAWLARVNFAARVADGAPELTRGAALDELFPPRRRGDADAVIADLSRALLGGELPALRTRALRRALVDATDTASSAADTTAKFRACAHAILCAPEAHLA
jgi:uncharacterized protein (DUF1800 family)